MRDRCAGTTGSRTRPAWNGQLRSLRSTWWTWRPIAAVAGIAVAWGQHRRRRRRPDQQPGRHSAGLLLTGTLGVDDHGEHTSGRSSRPWPRSPTARWSWRPRRRCSARPPWPPGRRPPSWVVPRHRVALPSWDPRPGPRPAGVLARWSGGGLLPDRAARPRLRRRGPAHRPGGGAARRRRVRGRNARRPPRPGASALAPDRGRGQLPDRGAAGDGDRRGPLLSPWAGLGVPVLYAAVALGAGARVLAERDA